MISLRLLLASRISTARAIATTIPISIILALSLLATPGLHATAQEIPKDPAPPLDPARPLVLPKIVQEQLDNGLKIVLLEDHKQPALWLRLALPAGSIRDPEVKVGLAEMVAEMLDKGTATRSESQIADTVDGLGASLGASAGKDFFTVSASGLSTQGDTLFTLLADITLHPTFPTKELERVRTGMLNAITQSLADSDTMASAALSRLIYGTHPYGNFASGTPKTISAITQADLKKFYTDYFAPNGSTLFLAGDITVEEAMQQIKAAFGTWKRRPIPPLPDPPKPPPATGDKPEITLIDRPGAAQTQIRIGTLIPGRKDPRRIQALVASAVLGEGQFEGRLTKEIRVKRGLTYGVGSAFARNAQAGIFEISTFTKNASTAEVLTLALEEALKLTHEPTPAAELQARKDYLNGGFAVGLATLSGLLTSLESVVLYGNGPDDLTTRIERVQAVTPIQIQEVMNTLLLEHARIVLVGDAQAIEKQIAPLGTVTKIAYGNVDLLSPTLQAGNTAATPPTVESDVTPEERTAGKAQLAAIVKAHGGDAFLNLKQLVMKGKGEILLPGQPMKLPLETATLTIVVPNKGRLDLKIAAGNIVFIDLGDAGGWISALGRVQDTPPGPVGSFDPTGLLRLAVQKNYAVRPLRETDNGKRITSEDGKALSGLAIIDAKGHVSRVYAEAETHLVRYVEEEQGAVVLLLSNYKATDGVQLPGMLQIRQGGKEFVNLTLDSFTLNRPVDDMLFVRPK